MADDIGEALDFVVGAGQLGGPLRDRIFEAGVKLAQERLRAVEVGRVAQDGPERRTHDERDQRPDRGEHDIEPGRRAFRRKGAPREQQPLLGLHFGDPRAEAAHREITRVAGEVGHGANRRIGAAFAVERRLRRIDHRLGIGTQGRQTRLLAGVVQRQRGDRGEHARDLVHAQLSVHQSAGLVPDEKAAPRRLELLGRDGEPVERALDLEGMDNPRRARPAVGGRTERGISGEDHKQPGEPHRHEDDAAEGAIGQRHRGAIARFCRPASSVANCHATRPDRWPRPAAHASACVSVHARPCAAA